MTSKRNRPETTIVPWGKNVSAVPKNLHLIKGSFRIKLHSFLNVIFFHQTEGFKSLLIFLFISQNLVSLQLLNRQLYFMIQFFRKVRDLIIRIIDWFYFPFLRFIPIEVFRYAATGGANTVFDIFLYFIFYRFVLQMQIVDLGFVAISPHIAAFLMVFPITFTTGFLLAKYVTFTASELHGRIQLFRYGVSVAGSIILNYAFLKLFVEVAGLYATLSKIMTTSIVIVYSYTMQRYFSFKTNKILVQENISD